MSYIRGRYYTWIDGKNIHLSNDIIPLKVFDELVIMRYAQLSEDKKKLKKIEKRAIKKHSGNFGCDSLCKKHGRSTTIELIETIKK